jgi:hypothetical protein
MERDDDSKKTHPALADAGPIHSPSRQLRDFTFRIEMLRPPAEIAPGFRAAKLLVKRIAPGRRRVRPPALQRK